MTRLRAKLLEDHPQARRARTAHLAAALLALPVAPSAHDNPARSGAVLAHDPLASLRAFNVHDSCIPELAGLGAHADPSHPGGRAWTADNPPSPPVR